MHALVRSVARTVLSQPVLGAIDYFRHPEQRGGWDGPFNGQQGRRALFHEIVAGFRPELIVETGTHRGGTTEFMAATGIEIHSVEFDARLYGYAKLRLRRHRNVRLYCDDTIALLPQLAAMVGPRRTLFYLDAHCEGSHPLHQELDIIMPRCPNAAVMIDDMQVPHDPGYLYDIYEDGFAFTFDYLRPAIEKHRAAVFFPTLRGEAETGWRRGCVVLAPRGVGDLAELTHGMLAAA